MTTYKDRRQDCDCVSGTAGETQQPYLWHSQWPFVLIGEVLAPVLKPRQWRKLTNKKSSQ